MKRLFLALLCITTVFSFTSCDVEDEINNALGDLLNFNFEFDESITVPPIIDSAPENADFMEPDTRSIKLGSFKSEISDFIDENNLDTDNIESVTISELTLKTDANFNSIEGVEITLNNVIIGSIDTIPVNAQEIQLILNDDQNLKDIISQEEVSLNIELITRESISESLTIDVESEFLVNGRVTL